MKIIGTLGETRIRYVEIPKCGKIVSSRTVIKRDKRKRDYYISLERLEPARFDDYEPYRWEQVGSYTIDEWEAYTEEEKQKVLSANSHY